MSVISQIIPAALCIFILKESYQSLPYLHFREEFTALVASPLYLTLCGSALFYSIALMRHQPLSLSLFVSSVLGFTVVGPNTFDMQTLTNFQPLPFMLVGCLLLTKGLLSKRSGQLVLGVAGVSFWICCALTPYSSSFLLILIFYHALLAALLYCGLFFKDVWAADCLMLGTCGVALAAILALIIPLELPAWLPSGIELCYACLLAALALGIAYKLRILRFFYLGVVILGGTMMELGRLLLQYLQNELNFQGLESYLIGFALLLAGMLMSVAKAGGFKRLRFLLPKPLRDPG